MGVTYQNDTPPEKTDEDGPQEQYSPVPAAMPPPVYTIALLICIGLVFVAQFATSQDPQFLSIDRYSAMYAGFDKQEFLHGQYWRILTGATIHSGILHVVMNGYALYMFGRLIEILSNRAHVAIVFLLSAIGGGLLSLAFLPDVTSVGASGGIVGLLSYLAVYAFRRRKFISPAFRKNLLINIGFILLFGIVLIDKVDNFGHIGGLVTGAVYGWIQIPGDENKDPREASVTVRAAGVLCLAIYAAACIWSIFLLINALQ